MTPPTVVLNTPADTVTIYDSTPTLAFTGTYSEADDIEYNVQIDTVSTFNSGSGLNKLSASDVGFVDVTNGADTHPFASGDQINYTVQAADVLSLGIYYWRARSIDPTGSNTYGAWTTPCSFNLANGAPSVVLDAPADTVTISDSTPTLAFTGTDADSDMIEYNVQVDTVPSFQSSKTDVVYNLITNPSLESVTGGWADGWTRNDTGIFTIDTNNKGIVPSPTNSLKIILSGSAAKACWTPIFDVNPAKTYYFSFYLHVDSFTTGSLDWAFDEFDSGSGWISWQYKSYKAATGCWQISGTYMPSSGSVAKAQLYLMNPAGATLTAYADQFEVYEVSSATNGAKVSIAFDDGYGSAYANRNIFSSRGIPATWYIVSDFIGTAGFASWADVQDIHDKYGWEIANHTKSHIDLTAQTESTIDTEISICQAAIISNTGITPTTIAWPYGAYNDLTKEVAARYVNGMRTYTAYGSGGDIVAPYENVWIIGNTVENTDAVATVKSWIDTAISAGNWLVLVFHELVASSPTQYQWTIADMEELLDYIALKSSQNLVKPMTVEGGLTLKATFGASLDTKSEVDAGFTAGHPFISGNATDYTVQSGNELNLSTTYYWRVRGTDPLGSNTYGAWAASRSFTIMTSPTGIKVWNGSAWVAKPVKVWNGSAWVAKPVKVWNGSAWVIKG